MSGKTITATAVISASDRTGTTLDKIAAKFKGLEKNAKAMEGIKPLKFTGNLDDELRRLKLSEKQLQGVRKEMALFQQQLKADPVGRRPSMYFRAMDDWTNKTVQHWRQVRVAADEAHAAQEKYAKTWRGSGMASLGGWIGAGAVGYYGGRAARFALDKSKEMSRETTKQRQAGLTQAQSDAIAAEAERQSQLYPSISQTEFRSAGREAVMQMGNEEAGLKMMPTIGKFMTAGKVLWGSDKIEEQTRKALQVLDARQITDPERANSLLDALVRSSQVEGGPDFKAEDLRTALRYGRDMTRGQSDRFITGVLPQLGVDMGYSQAGTGLASMHSALIGGRQKEAADEFQRKAGLRTDKGLVGHELFTRDVDKWFDQHFIPAMKKAGVKLDDPAEVAAFNSKFFSNRTAADVAGNLVSGQAQRVKRDEQRDKATGMAGAETLHTKDVGVALEGVSSQLSNLASNARTAEASIGTLNSIMGTIQKIESTGATAALAEGVRNNVQDIINMAEDWAALAARVKKVFSDPLGSLPKSESQRSRGGAKWPTLAAPVPYYAGGSEWNATYVPATGGRTPGATRLGGGRMLPPPQFPAPEVSPTMTHNTGVGAGGAQNVSVAGTVSGEAKIEQTLHIQASPYFDAKMNELKGMVIKLHGQVNSNGVGSTGKSSPDAAAPSAPHVGSAGNSPL